MITHIILSTVVALLNGTVMLYISREEMIDHQSLHSRHLETQCINPAQSLRELQHYGGSFLGTVSA